MFNNSIITDAGVALEGSWVTGSTLTFTGAAIGAGMVPFSQMRLSTALVDQRSTIDIESAEAVTGGIKLTLSLTSDDVTEDFQAQEIGIFAKVDDGNPVLLALFQDAGGMPVPSFSSMPDFTFSMSILLRMDNTGDFTVFLDPDFLVTHKQLSQAFKSQPTQIISVPKNPSRYFAAHEMIGLSPAGTISGIAGGALCFIGFADAATPEGSASVPVIVSGRVDGLVKIKTDEASMSAGTRLYPVYGGITDGAFFSSSPSGSKDTNRVIYLAEDIPAESGPFYVAGSVWIF